MSEAETREFAQEAVRAFNERDADWVIANSTSDLEWHPAIAAGVEGGKPFRGHSGVHEMFGAMDEVWEEFILDPEEIRYLGDAYLLLMQVRLKGKTGVELEHSMDAVIELRDGKMARGRSYLNRDEALEAAARVSGKAVEE
jgi:ketosteroid isomerase-like protein